ncbi:MAG TPA: polysaccharide deacetylase family protein [Flavisolibacter sp.]|nr:polysaccharide deacetylase family protein [Flavisolibacter sp.]
MQHLLLLTLLFPLSLTVYGQTQKAAGSRKAIICLTYDDGLQSQLSTVLSQLDSAGLKGTFFLNSIQGSSEVIGETSPAIAAWTNAAINGHELANHTLFHACPEKLGWQKAFAIESYTVDKMIAEIKTENALLALLDPKRKRRAFAFPCNNFMIGGTDYTGIIKKQQLVSYGRAGGDRTAVIADFHHINTMKMPSWMVEEGTSLAELIDFAERVKKAGGMGIYQFHGIGAEFFKISKETHRAFLDYLKAHPDDYWVATFSAAMDMVTSK